MTSLVPPSAPAIKDIHIHQLRDLEETEWIIPPAPENAPFSDADIKASLKGTLPDEFLDILILDRKPICHGFMNGCTCNNCLITQEDLDRQRERYKATALDEAYETGDWTHVEEAEKNERIREAALDAADVFKDDDGWDPWAKDPDVDCAKLPESDPRHLPMYPSWKNEKYEKERRFEFRVRP